MAKAVSGLGMHALMPHTVFYCFSTKIYNEYIYIIYLYNLHMYIHIYMENGLATQKLRYVIRGERHTNVIHREAESKTARIQVTTRIQKSTKE